MPQKPLSDAELLKTVMTYKACGCNAAATAEKLGIDRRSVPTRLKSAAARKITGRDIEAADTPSATMPVDVLRERRKQEFEHLRKAKVARLLTPVRVNLDGPIGISHFGDPHLDDSGTDLAKIEWHTDIVLRTKGLYGANIGDGINAWTGRLARLYSQQNCGEEEAIALYKWWLKTLGPKMIYCIGGNHLAWHHGMGTALHEWIVTNCGTLFDMASVRFALHFPNGKQVRINARHDFRGHSMWNTVHGPLKAASMGWRDHVLTCGHLHTSGYSVLKDPATGLISHAMRVSSYKTFDRYAHEEGLPNADIFCNAVTIINPKYDDDDPRLIHTCFDVEEGADYLTWLRSKKT